MFQFRFLFCLYIFLPCFPLVNNQPLYSSSLLVQEGLSFCIEGILFSQSRMPQLFILFFAIFAKKFVFQFKLIRWLFDFLKTALSAGPIKPHTFVDQMLWYPKCLYTVFRLFRALSKSKAEEEEKK